MQLLVNACRGNKLKVHLEVQKELVPTQMSSSEDEFDVDFNKFNPSQVTDLDNLLEGQSMNILFNGRYYGARVKRITRYAAIN